MELQSGPVSVPKYDQFDRPVLSYDNTISGNTRTLSTAHSPSGVSRDSQIISGEPGVDPRSYENPVPNIPGRVSIGTGVAPLWSMNKTMGDNNSEPDSNLILGSSQARLLINALNRKQGTDLLSAPRVTVLNGELAKITVAQEFIFPTEFTQSAPATTDTGVTLTPAVPTFESLSADEGPRGFREVGVVLEVTPNIEKYNSIHLELKPVVTEFDGFIDYGGTAVAVTSNTQNNTGGGAELGNIFTSTAGNPTVVMQPQSYLVPIFR